MTPVIQTPRLIRIGGGAIDTLTETLASIQITRPLIVTDPFMVSSGMIAEVTDRLTRADIAHAVFSETVPDPTTEVVTAGVEQLQAGAPDGQPFDGLIGFGGGSPMDTAKAIAILAAGGGVMRDFKAPRSVDLPDSLPVLCIPTTAGTGSEATRFTIITDTQTDEKMLIQGLSALPVAAIVDYRLTMKKPFRLTADTGVDTMTHAIEAYVSRKANSVSDMYALEAMQLVAQHLATACFEPTNETAREGMARAALLAGLAFSNASVALVHGMSRPIGAHFHVPHGLSNAMLLPAVTRFSLEGNVARYATCARIMGWAPTQATDEAAADALVDGLIAQNAKLQVPTPGAWGIDRATFHGLRETMAAQALASGSPNNNPIIPTSEQIVDLYAEVYGA